jgi:hypothetical protein
MSKAFLIKDFPDYYATDNGDIYSRNYKRTGRIVKIRPNYCNGYYTVCLRKNNKTYRKGIHRLVAETFIPNPENKPQVNHKNGIRNDNRVENLEWVTRSENIQHAYTVLGNKSPNFGKFGKDNKSSKPILQLKDGKIISEFWGCNEAARKTGLTASCILRCCQRKKGYRSAGGFQWTYKDNNDKI